MIIDITGYVTELHGENGFKIKVTSDRVHKPDFTDLQVSKEVSIYISPNRYPSEDSSEFKIITGEDKGQKDRRDRINKFRYLSNTLSMGDRVKCAVFVVENYAINKRPKDIKAYAEFDLWLCPYEGCLERIKVDSRESLKFRKQWFYTCVNGEKYEKITGYSLGNYWWVNKKPIITFPILWWIRVKTKISNLWGEIMERENLLKNSLAILGLIVGILGLIATIIFGIISLNS